MYLPNKYLDRYLHSELLIGLCVAKYIVAISGISLRNLNISVFNGFGHIHTSNKSYKMGSPLKYFKRYLKTSLRSLTFPVLGAIYFVHHKHAEIWWGRNLRSNHRRTSSDSGQNPQGQLDSGQIHWYHSIFHRTTPYPFGKESDQCTTTIARGTPGDCM
jgi:hypothetical protein